MRIRSEHPVFALVLIASALAAPAAAAPVNAFSVPAERTRDFVAAEEAIRAGEYEKALALLELIHRRKPDLPGARLVLARMLLAGGQFGPGRTQLEACSVESPADPEVFVTFANLAVVEGRWVEAELHLGRAGELAGGAEVTPHVRRRVQLAVCAGRFAVAEARGKWEPARTLADDWLKLDPGSAPARAALARCLFHLGLPDEAAAAFAGAVEADPSMEPPALSIARLYSAKAEPQKAGEWMGRAVSAAPSDARVRLAYAWWLLEQYRIDEAKVQAETANSLDRNSTEPRRIRGLAARLAGDLAEAEFCFASLVRASPADSAAADQLALTLAASTDPAKQAKALELASINARQYPDNPAMAATLGWVYYRLGRLDDAERTLRDASPGGRVTPETAYYLAHVLAERGRLTEARDALKLAVSYKGLFLSRRHAKAWLSRLEKPGG